MKVKYYLETGEYAGNHTFSKINLKKAVNSWINERNAIEIDNKRISSMKELNKFIKELPVKQLFGHL